MGAAAYPGFDGLSGGATKKVGGPSNGMPHPANGAAAGGAGVWGRFGGGGGGGGGGVKRKRAESPPTKDKEREVDRNRINKRDMWSYACMSHVSKEELERQALLDEQQPANPWEWTRKLIVRPTGLPCTLHPTPVRVDVQLRRAPDRLPLSRPHYYSRPSTPLGTYAMHSAEGHSWRQQHT
jgi:hypothetical protein